MKAVVIVLALSAVTLFALGATSMALDYNKFASSALMYFGCVLGLSSGSLHACITTQSVESDDAGNEIEYV